MELSRSNPFAQSVTRAAVAYAEAVDELHLTVLAMNAEGADWRVTNPRHALASAAVQLAELALCRAATQGRVEAILRDGTVMPIN